MLSLDKLTSSATKWLETVRQLPYSGGPSVTRWVFVRTAEVISIGWLALVGSVIWVYARYQKADAIYCGMILTLGAGLFKFAQQTQVAKLSIGTNSTDDPKPEDAN